MAPNDKQVPTQQQLLELVLNLGGTQDRLFDVIRDSATNAAIDFLGVRLARAERQIEKSGEVSASELFVDIMLSLTLGPLATALVNRLSSALLRAVIRPRQAFLVKVKGKRNSVFRYSVTEQGITDVQKIYGRAKIDQEFIRDKENRERLSNYQAWSAVVTALSAEGLSRAEDALQAEPEFSPKPIDELSALTGLTAAIQHSCDGQRETSQRIFHRLHSDVAAGSFDDNGRRLLYDFLLRFMQESDRSSSEWKALRSSYQLFFEACMWAVYVQTSRVLAEDVQRSLTITDDLLSRVQTLRWEEFIIREKELVKYLLLRIPSPSGNGTDSFVDHHYRRTHPGADVDKMIAGGVPRNMYNWLPKSEVETITRELLAHLNKMASVANGLTQGEPILLLKY